MRRDRRRKKGSTGEFEIFWKRKGKKKKKLKPPLLQSLLLPYKTHTQPTNPPPHTHTHTYICIGAFSKLITPLQTRASRPQSSLPLSRPGYEIHPGPMKGGLQKSFLWHLPAKVRSSVLTDGHSIPGPGSVPERSQEMERSRHRETDWHFLTPMCLISAATSRHVQHEPHSLNTARSHWHTGPVMTVAPEWIGQWRVWIRASIPFN